MASEELEIIRSALSDPRRFLLADESLEEFEAYYGQLVDHFIPANILERRQVELIAQADFDIERQQRLIREQLRPDNSSSSAADKIAAGWMNPKAKNTNRKQTSNSIPEVFGDNTATPQIAQAHVRNSDHLSTHYASRSDADRRRRQAIALLFQIQDRRRSSEVAEAEVIEVSNGPYAK